MVRTVIAAMALLAGLFALTPAASAEAKPPKAGKLDVLFVGAHPDDESFNLSTYGQWSGKARVGVLTITRGEGGGNAVGTEEGPALGLLREAEERKAVAKAGIRDVHNLDKVDFYYTVSAPLTAEQWKHRETLSRVVRLIRRTQPKVVVTMDPGTIPFQHGNHQEAGRLSAEAYKLAADPSAFPEQLTREKLKPWRVGRFFHQEHLSKGTEGQGCERNFTPSVQGADIFGVWAGRKAPSGKTWAQVEVEAEREYKSQGWANTPDAPEDPAKIGCDYFTQIDARVPFTRGATGPASMLEGAVVQGGLPLGTEFFLTSGFAVTPGKTFTVTARARARTALPSAKAALQVPSGWKVAGSGDLGTVGARERTAAFKVTPTADAKTDERIRIGATLTTAKGTGSTGRAVSVTPQVTGRPEPLERVAEYDRWTAAAGVPQLSDRTKRVTMLGSGKSRTLKVLLANTSGAKQSGKVSIDLPDGFSSDAAAKPYELAAGAQGSLTFTVKNTDSSLPTSQQGGEYGYTLTTTSVGAPDVEKAALELVPGTSIGKAPSEPAVDGKESAGEYGGTSLDLSRLWEGEKCEPEDCSATGKVAWSGDALYFLIKVRDDKRGTVLGTDDCKRHWRTDSVEIAIDPKGDSENTSSTFKTGIFPAMADGKPCFERDADHHQGGADTAPGMKVASVVSSPYDGYTIEAKIPAKALPSTIDRSRIGLNVFAYDSDTTDKTGQSRIGWSTWGGVQGTPWRWGQAELPGFEPPSVPSSPPVMPSEATLSVNSPQSILQAAATGIPLAGGPPSADKIRILGKPVVSGSSVSFRLRADGPGTVYAHMWDGKLLGSRKLPISRPGTYRMTVPGASGTLAVAFAASSVGTHSVAAGVG